MRANGEPAGFVDRVLGGMGRSDNWLQLLRFGVVGGSGYVINLIVFAVLTQLLDAHHLLGGVGAFLVAVTNNFLINRQWTFRAGGPYRGQATRFLTVSVFGLGLNLALLDAFIAVGLPDLVAQAVAVACVMPVNFVGNKLWTFSR